MSLFKKLLILSLFSLSSSSFAFTLYGQCLANFGGATCLVNNPTPYPIFCQISVTGVSSLGYSAFQNSFSVIYPYSWKQAYVYSFNPYVDPLISATYFANCNY